MSNLKDPQLASSNNIESTKKIQINDRILIPYFSLYSDRIVLHPRPFNGVVKRKQHPNSINNLKKTKFQGNISKCQKSTIKKKLTSWLSSIEHYNLQLINKFQKKPHYPVFVTLTLSSKQIHPDQEIKKRLLDLFIKTLKYKFDVKYYFWRAESQKNGNIHFHLLIDKYVSYLDLKNCWNRIQNKLNYIDEFEKIHNHRNPNSVDIRSANKTSNFINYVIKYCIKDEKVRKVAGRVFGMSDSLRTIAIYQNVLDSYLSDDLIKYEKHNYFKIYKQEYSTVIIFQPSFYKTSLYNQLINDSHSYYLDLYSSLYSSKCQDKKIINTSFEQLINKPQQLQLTKFIDQVKVINNYNHMTTMGKKNYPYR